MSWLVWVWKPHNSAHKSSQRPDQHSWGGRLLIFNENHEKAKIYKLNLSHKHTVRSALLCCLYHVVAPQSNTVAVWLRENWNSTSDRCATSDVVIRDFRDHKYQQQSSRYSVSIVIFTFSICLTCSQWTSSSLSKCDVFSRSLLLSQQ